MPITIEQLDDAILLVTIAGKCLVQDVNSAFSESIFPFCNGLAPKNVNIIYDISTLDWDFSEFVEYLYTTREDNENGIVPTNMQQHFVGNSRWVESLQSWLNNHYNRNIRLFSDLESALKYVRSHP